MLNTAWGRAPLKLSLTLDTVHVWRINLPMPESFKIKLAENLIKTEIERLNSFFFDRDKERFLVSRGGLKDILSRYLECSPVDIQLEYTAYGKPYLRNSDLRFNVSHAGNCILYAISKDIEVGIDIEYLNKTIDFLEIAQNFFSENEYKGILMFSQEDERINAFYRCWTRKEALMKGIGKGLSIPLNQIEVDLLSEEGLAVLKGDLLWEGEWQLKEINVGKEYIAVLARAKNFGEINYWDWQNIYKC